MKKITLFLFYILPSKIANIFVSLSIISMIMEIRHDKIQSDQTLVAKISEVLKVHLNDSVLLLPEQTLNWYWKPELFDTYILVDNKSRTLREIILDPEDFMRHKGTVLNAMLDSLPLIMKRKLRLYEPQARLIIKHNIVNTFIHG
ncbi:hypothetical protein [Flavobacterium sp.]|jgi:hypothetical protein|uniref:hypothetical protein n=1 Tax=Flavobacterium sp. TaxID=239 RepID=UPI0037C10D40